MRALKTLRSAIMAAGALLGGVALFAWLVRRYPLAADLRRTVRAATGPA